MLVTPIMMPTHICNARRIIGGTWRGDCRIVSISSIKLTIPMIQASMTIISSFRSSKGEKSNPHAIIGANMTSIKVNIIPIEYGAAGLLHSFS